MRWAVPTILLAILLPLPGGAAQADAWSVDAVVAVREDGSADYVWTISGLTNTRLTLPLPDSGTFVEARDVDGKPLAATADAHDVEVTAGSKPFTLRFSLQGEEDGPFVVLPAQVASAADSPVTVGITLPAGWSLSGYRDNDDERPDSTGVFRKTGPSYVQFLVARAGVTDAGPDTRVAGQAVMREGFANVTAGGVQWSLVTTYDADVYSRDWDVHVPPGGTVTRAHTPFGELETTPTADGVKVRTPYLVGYGLGGRSFTVEMTLPPAEAHGGPFRQTNVSIRAAEGDTVTLVATLPTSAQYAGARVSGGVETAPLRFAAAGPLSVGLSFLPAATPDHVQFSEGMFVVDAPRALEAAARATARNASELLPRVASFAYDAADARPFFVAYTDAAIFGWEEGFYSNGLNTISIRTSTLDEAADGKAHLVPVAVLVHEATHGLLDRRIPDAPHNLSFLHEGLSRLAETRTEMAFSGEIVRCSESLLSTQCRRHSARPAADEREPGPHDVFLRYRAGTAFDAAWSASRVSDDERGALYDYSGMVLHAYTQRAPPGALENALLHVARTKFIEVDATDAALLTEILLKNAPGTSAQALLYPGAEAASLPLDQFRHCMGSLLAPAYPWEQARAPPGGCPASGYGARDAPLPPPPTMQTETSPATTTSPPPPPPPRISPPLTTTTDDPAGTAPGAVIEGEPGGSNPPAPRVEVEIPGAPLALALLAVGTLALATRRR